MFYAFIYIFYSRGVPGVDWSIDTGDTTKLSKLYYNTYSDNIPVGVGLLI